MNRYSIHIACRLFGCLSTPIVSIFLLFGLSDAQAARVVAEKRECATCHIAWIADFKREDAKTLIPNEPRPVVDTGRQDVVSTEMMCFSCHDGYVLDSRFLWLDSEHSHPVGVVPSDSVQIPKDEGKTIFPLNDDGKIYCGTCHSAHGVEWGDKLSPVFLRTQNIASSLCKTCHVDRKGEYKGKLNHPLEKEVPEEAKRLLKSGAKLSSKDEVTCQSCHRVHGSKEEKLLVVKNDRSQLCVNCHREKSGKDDKGKRRHISHPVDVVPKVASVPEQFTDSGSKFGPNQEIECQTCHEIHLAPSEKLLVLDESHLEEGICVNCHDDKRTLLSSGHNLLREDATTMLAEDQRPSANLGVCGVCHNMHDGQGPKMWARALSKEGDRIASLCLSCHSDGEPAEKHTVGKYSHPVGASLPSNVDEKVLPLFTAAGSKTRSNRYGLVTCPTCHDVHGPASKVYVNPPAKKKRNGIGKYLRKGEGNLLSLCETCHKDKWPIESTKHNLKSKGQSSQPLGICSNCHQVHNGKGPRMWARDGKLDENDPGALCNNCHNKDGLAEDKTIGNHSHPIGVSIEKAGIEVTDKGWVTEVNGKRKSEPSLLPLYDKKGNKLQRGSGHVACGTCHDPHVWSASAQARQTEDGNKEEGDARTSFLRIPAAPDGELCVTCHKTKATVRATDHDLSVSAPNATNNLGGEVVESGVCGQCHAVHNAVQELALWGRVPGEAVSSQEMLCRSCHLPGEIAEKKVPEKALHPLYVMAWDSELRDPDKKDITRLPVFSYSGKRAMTGFITCPTCHNVHQWRGATAEEGPGVNEEGDVFSSFLRMRTTEGMLCEDCHGIDSLFRYKYFHGVDFSSRKDE